jgi:hypothetical protein
MRGSEEESVKMPEKLQNIERKKQERKKRGLRI